MPLPGQDRESEQLLAENSELRQRLEEAEETLRAIQSGSVDALVVSGEVGPRIYTLESADRPYRLLIEQMQQGAITLDTDGTVLYSNIRFAEMLGLPQSELVGMALAEAVASADRNLYEALLRDGKAGASQGEIRLQREDGSVIPVFLTLNVLPPDSGAPLGGLITDLTAQKHQEKLATAHETLHKEREKLRQSEERFRTLVETSAQIVWTAHADGAIVEDSPSWRAFTGQLHEERIGMGWLDVLHPDDRDHVAALWHNAVAETTPVHTEYRILHTSGDWRWTLCRVVPLFESDGSVRGWVGMNIDITDHKRIQQEREGLLLRERAARAEAEAASRMKDEFLATVSHELRTPLNAVIGWAHMLRGGQVEGTKVQEALETIERNARAQVQLINDLLDVSRIITGKLRLNVRSFDPISSIESAIAAVHPAAEAKGVRIQRVLDTGIGAISGDADRLQQIVWNLLSNAIKFTPRGGRIHLRLERVNSHIEIIVTDTGMGINPEFLPFVFDRFRQADSTSTRAYGGLGLGLAIVRHLVELHGGEVHANSHGEGHGSTFTVKLPLLPVFEQETVPPRSGEPLPDCPDRLDGLEVLAVDDEPDAGDLLKVMLERCGAEVTVATSAQFALDAVKERQFDVIVSDIGMPGTDGYELIQMIRSLPEDRGKTPAIALTAYARTEDRLRALRAGYQTHVPKPIEYAELVAVMASLARRRDNIP